MARLFRICSIILIPVVLSFSWRPQISRRSTSLRMLTDIDDADYQNESDAELYTSTAALRQLQVRFNCETVDSDVISEVLFEAGVLSVSVEVEDMLEDVYNDEKKWGDLQKTRSWKTAMLRANIPSSFDSAGLIDILQAVFEKDLLETCIVDVEQKDWVKSVQQNWLPQVIGDLTVKFPWHEDVESTTRYELILQGGAAFGTGDHPTTRLCTRWIQRSINNAGGRGLSILDVGTGSGLLGLAALRYGAVKAVGTDIDKDALVNALMNCEQNKLSMELYLASEDDCVSDEEKSIAMLSSRGSNYEFPNVSQLKEEEFDLTVANILAPILITLAPAIAANTKSGGLVALSGLVTQQADRVISEYSKYFVDMKVEEAEEDWVVVTGKRK
jgi:ribosomal protein L11 methyltransferase